MRLLSSIGSFGISSVIVCAVAVSTPPQTFAQSATNSAQVPAYAENQLTLSPAYQEVVLSSQQPTASASVTVKNTTNQSTTFEVFAIEFPDNQHFGSLQFINFSDDQVRRQQPAYITFDAQQFVLEPQQERTITTRITDRAQLRPGGNYAAVIVRAIAQVTITNQIVVPALSSQLLIRKLDGEIRNLSLTNIAKIPSGITFVLPKETELTFKNNGNVHLIPRGVVTVTDLLRRTVSKGIINDASLYVLPSRTRVISVPLKKITYSFPLALYTATVVGTAETTSYSNETFFLYISPWLVVSLVVIGIGFAKYRKHRNITKLSKTENRA